MFRRVQCPSGDLDSTRRWLRFRFRGAQLVAFLPSGKVVLVDGSSSLMPSAPGHYFAASIKNCGNVAFAVLTPAHRALKFTRSEAFGATCDGVTVLSKFSAHGGKTLRFVCDPAVEHLERFGFNRCVTRTSDGRWEYMAFRHGKWRLLNWYGPCRMTNELFHAAARRVHVFSATLDYVGSPCSCWSAALAAGVITTEELAEASRRYGPLWHYEGS